jgi:hypothetical protein
MFISKNYPQNLNESVTIARHYGNSALEFQFKQDAQQLMHRHFQQCAQLIYLHQIPSLQTVDNRLLLFCIFYPTLFIVDSFQVIKTDMGTI